MRGDEDVQGILFHDFRVEDQIPESHPLRKIKQLVDQELAKLNRHFDAAYSTTGRPSIPPEQLIKATLLQALYSIRSERQLCEQIAYNLLFRWFLDLPLYQGVWNPTTFTKNRERFAEHGLMQKFFESSALAAITQQAASEEHFSVDGTLIQAWASMKSVRPKDEVKPPDDKGDSNGWVNWHGEQRKNATHQSTTDPEARLSKKSAGEGAKLSHSLHVLMENRNGLVMDIQAAEANGTAERETAKDMLRRAKRRLKLNPKTVGADKGYDDGPFLADLENRMKIVPHVPVRSGPINGEGRGPEARRQAKRRQRNQCYQMSQRCRKKIEEIFGWLKTIGGMRRTRFVGRWKTQLYGYCAAAAYNFLRLSKLDA